MQRGFLAFLLAAALVVALPVQKAYAVCANPAGAEGEVIYNSTHKILQFCNGTLWIATGGQITEVDPKVGTLTATKWCTANAGGTAIDCTEDDPSGGGSADNLGNHTATQALNMATFNITNAGAVTGTSFSGNGTSLTGLDAANITTGNLGVARLNSGTGASGTTFWRGDGTWATVPSGADNLGNHIATTTLSLSGNWLNGDSGTEGISISSTGQVRIDQGGEGGTYDLWLQGGSGTSGTARRLGLLGTEAGMLYLNYASEYASGVTIGGPVIIAAGALSDNSIVAADIAAGAVDSSEIAAAAVDLTHLSATGTKSSSTFLRGDNTWAAAGGGTFGVTSASCAMTGSATSYTCTATCPATYLRTGCSVGDTSNSGSDGSSARPSGSTACICWANTNKNCYAYCARVQ